MSRIVQMEGMTMIQNIRLIRSVRRRTSCTFVYGSIVKDQRKYLQLTFELLANGYAINDLTTQLPLYNFLVGSIVSGGAPL